MLRRIITYLLFSVAVFFVLWTRVPTVSTLLFNLDESPVAVIASVINEGGLPYRDAFGHRGPVTYYLFALIFKLFGAWNMTAVHGVLAGMVLVILGLVCLCARSIGNSLAAVFSALVFAVVSSNFFHGHVLALHTEWPLIVFTTLGALLFFSACDRPDRRKDFAGGLSFGFAFLCKQPALLDFGVPVFLLLIALAGRGRRAALLRLISLVAGLGLVVAGCAAAFFFQGAWADFVQGFWTYNTKIYMSGITPLMRGHSFLHTFSGRYAFLIFNPILLIAFGAAFIRIVYLLVMRREKLNGILDIKEAFVLLWCLSAALGASLSARNFGHYYLQLLPPFSILAGLMLARLWTWSPGGGRVGSIAGFAWKVVVILLLFAQLRGYAQNQHLFQKVDEEYRFKVKAGLRDAAMYVRKHTRPDDKIFVWGFAPEIYLIARRLPSTRYLFCNPLTGLVPWTNEEAGIDTRGLIMPGSWRRFAEDLRRQKPAYIVDTSTNNFRYYGKYSLLQYPAMGKILGKYYEPTDFQKRSGRWRQAAVYRLRDGMSPAQ